jgi:alkylhydroperoxidase family enzyme
MNDADKNLNNFNWTKGLQSESDWIWSGNLNPVAFPNNLARYFLHIPGVFEQQLNYSTTLIFDEPSFRNGVQISGFVPRVTRELVISFIAQLRRSRYSMTHHAVLGALTARKHGLTDDQISAKWGNLLDSQNHPDAFTRLEQACLKFARCFATDPKTYVDSDYTELRAAFSEENARTYWDETGWLKSIQAARVATALGLAAGKTSQQIQVDCRAATAGLSQAISHEDNERKVNAQVIELAFIALQFVALTGVFSSLNIPDEDFLDGVSAQVVPERVRTVIASILSGTTADMPTLVPAAVQLPVKEIMAGQVRVEPTLPRGRRVPLVSWEVDPEQGTRDKGLALGGIHVGVYGWSFGSYFPGSLTYALMHHGELARYEAPYSLPLLFNEDEWRNGTQTAGFNRPPIKELVIQKIYHILRSRYGLEHHTMFFFNAILQFFGVGAFRVPGMTDEQHALALKTAIGKAETMLLHIDNHREAPSGTFSTLEVALLDWIETFVTAPHAAHKFEGKLRDELTANNQLEIDAGLRRLDTMGVQDPPNAMKRLIDHQISELAMVAGHMDGLGRLLTIMQLESELQVDALHLVNGPGNTIQFALTGAMNNRPSLFDALRFSNVTNGVLTYNELLVNPSVNHRVRDALGADPSAVVAISQASASASSEF